MACLCQRYLLSFSWLHLCFLVLQCAPALMFLRSPAVLPALIWCHWERIPKLQEPLFIYLSLCVYLPFLPCCCFVSQTDKRITANWIWPAWQLSEIMKPLFPCIFSPRMASLSSTSVHIKVPNQCGIWGWRKYWSHWEPERPYLLLLHWGRGGIMEPKATLSDPGDDIIWCKDAFWFVC